MAGKLYLCATPIGNLGDMTPRVIETLGMVDLIAAEDTRNSIKLLNHFEIKTHMISYHKYNESERASSIISKMLDEDIDVAIGIRPNFRPCGSKVNLRIDWIGKLSGNHATRQCSF